MLLLCAACEPAAAPGLGQDPGAVKAKAPALDPTYASAAKALERGHADEAFELCKPSDAGVVKTPDCHRVLGVIYKQRGDKQAACASFLAYQRGPHVRDLPSIERMIKNLGCAP